MKPVRWTAVTRGERQVVVDAIRSAIAEVGGWIDDVHLYSNIAIALRFHAPAGEIDALWHILCAIGLTLDGRPADGTTSAGDPRDAEVACSLQVTFFHGEPDLRRAVPGVPG